jgi:hypothetical protein
MTTTGSKYRETKEFHLVYYKLITAAQSQEVVYYKGVAKILGIETPGHHMAREVGQILGEISEDEHRAGRPMLSALAVASSGFPGEGFFKLARRVGKLSSTNSDDERDFWLAERNQVYDTWKVDE